MQVKDYNIKITLAARGNTVNSQFTDKSDSTQAAQLELRYCNVYHNKQTATVILENPVGSGNFITYGSLCTLVSIKRQTVMDLIISKVKKT